MPRPRLDAADLTVVILTLNEAGRLSRCMAAIPGAYPVLVLDSGSLDGTPELAREGGAEIRTNPWRGFAAQRNFALESCGIASPWVLFVDADEIYGTRFFDWFETVKGGDDFDVAYISSHLFLDGRKLRHAPGYPIWHPRLVRRDRVRFLQFDSGHGETVPANLRRRMVDIPYRHDFFDGDLAAWMIKHIGHAQKEAFGAVPQAAIATTGRSRLRRVARGLPFKPILRFFYHYVLRGGFLDGSAGLHYSCMYAWYEATKSLWRLRGRTGA